MEYVSGATRVRSLDFGLSNPDDILRMSVVEVFQTSLYEQSFPRDNGCNDLRMGTVDRNLSCSTCKNNSMQCPGHFGHIMMARPMYHTNLINVTMKVLRCVCFWCSKLLVEGGRDSKAGCGVVRRRKLLANISKAAKQKTVCIHCGGAVPSYTRTGNGITHEFEPGASFESEEERADALGPFTAERAHSILQDMSDEDILSIGMCPKRSRPSWLLLTVLAVPPPCVRPSVCVSEGSKSRGEDYLTVKLQDIVKSNKALATAMEKGDPDTIAQCTTVLQSHIAMYMDKDSTPGNSSSSSFGMGRSRARRAISSNGNSRSLTGRMKGKRGRIRNNIMGKRVNFSSRTVITPDASMDIDCLGVPEQVAAKQTVPERVTRLNLERLTKCVRIGGGRVGGASKVHMGHGRVCNLSICSNAFRKKLQLKPGMTVERHLRDGDWVVFNRQPTLHTGSMMGHRVKIMKGLTFRLPVPDTTPYNADFDGDEMNMHTPQDVETAAEVQGLMSITSQMLGAQSNCPIIGCVQDTTIGMHLLSRPGTLLERSLFMDLVASCHHSDHQEMPVPAVLKPRRLFTGLQAISHALPRVTLFRPHLLRFDADAFMQHRRVFVRDGELASGVLSKKNALGSGPGGLVHETCLHLGNARAVGMLSDLQRMAASWLTRRGCSVGLGDCVLSPEQEKAVQDSTRAHVEAAERADVGESRAQDIISNALSSTGAIVLESVRDPRGQNMLNALVESGSKGSVVNLAQILGGVGQQSQSGGRVCREETLTSFAPNSRNVTSRGFCASSYTKGLSMEELFMHTVSGREGLIDTAIKTALSGYVQRRMVKGMEQIVVGYDGTIRGSKRRLLQTSLGGTGLGCRRTERIVVEELTLSREEIVRRHGRVDGLRIVYLRDRVQRSRSQHLPATTLDEVLIPFNPHRVLHGGPRRRRAGACTANDVRSHRKRVQLCCERLAKILGGRARAVSVILAVRVFFGPAGLAGAGYAVGAGSVGPFLDRVIDRVQQAVAPPGENVGALAATSIGGPITQMTLNSVDYRTQLVVRWDTDCPCSEDGRARGARQIGETIDRLMASRPLAVQRLENDTCYLPLAPGEAQALTVDEQGAVSWEPLEAVTRHPPLARDGTRDSLLRVETASGRVVVATKAKSFLVIDGGGSVVPKEGKRLRVGDRLPVVSAVPAPRMAHTTSRVRSSTLDLKTVFARDEVVFSSELNRAKRASWEIMRHFRQAHAEPRRWTPHTHSVFPPASRRLAVRLFRIQLRGGFGPARSVDVLSCVLGYLLPRRPDYWLEHELWHHEHRDRLPAPCSGMRTYHMAGTSDLNQLVEPGLVFDNDSSTWCKNCCRERLPERLFLCRAFGQFVGAYLCADGYVDSGRGICLSKRASPQTVLLAKAWVSPGVLWGLGCPIRRRKRDGEILLHSLMARFLLRTCGASGSLAVPWFAYGAPVSFVSGILAAAEACPPPAGSKVEEGLRLLRLQMADGADIQADPVVRITEQESSAPFVYDLTVASTRNMVLSSGLAVRDTFHHAGTSSKSVTLGVPRFKEFLDATKNIRTPSLTVFPSPGIDPSDMRHLEERRLRDLVFGPADILTEEEYRQEFPRALGFEAAVEACRQVAVVTVKSSRRQKIKGKHIMVFRLDTGRIARYNSDAECLRRVVHDAIGNKFSTALPGPCSLSVRVIDVKDFMDPAASLEQSKMLTGLLVDHLMNIHVGGIEGIKNTYVEKSSDAVGQAENGGWHEQSKDVCTTDGSNLRECLAVEEVDWRHTSSNDIHEVTSVLGVEAGVVALGREMDKVVRFDGGYIDRKHITLLTESIMQRGFMCPNTRHGMARQRVGVLMRASFETTTDVFNESACHAMSDKVSGVTENIMFANSIPSGTGMIEALPCKEATPPRKRRPSASSRLVPNRDCAPRTACWNFFSDVHTLMEDAYLFEEPEDFAMFNACERENHPPNQEREKEPDSPASPSAPSESPRYAGPESPMYAAPESPRYSAPESPMYAAPESPRYSAPESPRYSAPESPRYSAPESPRYSAPESPRYSAPESPQYAGPESPRYSAPESPRYAGPESPRYSAPESPQHTHTQSPQYAPENLVSVDDLESLENRLTVFTSEDYTRGFSTEDLPSSRGISSPVNGKQAGEECSGRNSSDSSDSSDIEESYQKESNDNDNNDYSDTSVGYDNQQQQQDKKEIEKSEADQFQFDPMSPVYDEIQNSFDGVSFFDIAALGSLKNNMFEPKSPEYVE